MKKNKNLIQSVYQTVNLKNELHPKNSEETKKMTLIIKIISKMNFKQWTLPNWIIRKRKC